MFRTSADFRIGQLKPLEEQSFEIVEENQHLNFYVSGLKDVDSYSLEFSTVVSLEELLKFNLNEHIDFIRYVDDGDIVFGKNGVYSTNPEIEMDIVRYLSGSFVLVINFKERENLAGYLELDFSVEEARL